MGMAAVVEDTGAQVIVGPPHGTGDQGMVLGVIVGDMALVTVVGLIRPGRR